MSLTFRCGDGLEEVLHVQFDNAIHSRRSRIRRTRLAVHHTEGGRVVVSRDVFACVVHVVTQSERTSSPATAEIGKRMVQPVEETGAELDLLPFMAGNTERPVNR